MSAITAANAAQWVEKRRADAITARARRMFEIADEWEADADRIARQFGIAAVVANDGPRAAPAELEMARVAPEPQAGQAMARDGSASDGFAHPSADMSLEGGAC